MKILVTSGAEFIRNHLVDRLVEERWKVRVANNLSTGRPENLAHHRGEAEFIIGGLKGPHHRNEAVAKIARAMVEELDLKYR